MLTLCTEIKFTKQEYWAYLPRFINGTIKKEMEGFILEIIGEIKEDFKNKKNIKVISSEIYFETCVTCGPSEQIKGVRIEHISSNIDNDEKSKIVKELITDYVNRDFCVLIVFDGEKE